MCHRYNPKTKIQTKQKEKSKVAMPLAVPEIKIEHLHSIFISDEENLFFFFFLSIGMSHAVFGVYLW